MPTYVKSPTAQSVEKTAENEVKAVGKEADNVVQDLVESDGVHIRVQGTGQVG